ncbi:MAG: divergent polysaccharide deacetylase family protein [Pseudomonadales bacterium]
MSRLLLFLCLLIPNWLLAETIEPVSITIIIDDLGNNLSDGQRAINLPGPVTYAILPDRPYSHRLAEQAHRSGKEVMLHMPMDNTHDQPIGPGGLTIKQDRPHYEQRLQQAIATTPHIRGINNHMGSRLTANPERMQWLMQSLQNYPLYFVDSRTSADSVAATTASNHHIPTLERDVFLDHEANTAFIDKQFKRLLRIARKEGSAVAIGHPYPSTLSYLENILPQLAGMGVHLVKPSDLLAIKTSPDTQYAAQQVTPPKFKSKAEIKTIKTAKPAEKNPDTLLAKARPLAEGNCRIIEQKDVTRVSCG